MEDGGMQESRNVKKWKSDNVALANWVGRECRHGITGMLWCGRVVNDFESVVNGPNFCIDVIYN